MKKVIFVGEGEMEEKKVDTDKFLRLNFDYLATTKSITKSLLTIIDSIE